MRSLRIVQRYADLGSQGSEGGCLTTTFEENDKDALRQISEVLAKTHLMECPPQTQMVERAATLSIALGGSADSDYLYGTDR